MTLKAVIIGCGKVAGGYDGDVDPGFALSHASGYRRVEGVTLSAASDPSEMARQAFAKRWQVARTYENWQDMLAQEKPDMVSLCLPTALHLEAFRDCCKAGAKAILLEKPLAPTLDEATQIGLLGRGVTSAVAFHRRWNVKLAQLADQLHSGKHGAVRQITVRYTKGCWSTGRISSTLCFGCWAPAGSHAASLA